MVGFSLFVGAWWGQKAKMLKKVLVFKAFLKGQDGPEDASAANNGARNSGFGVALGIRK